MQLVIHRGTKEIGGSCVELKTANTRILINLGKFRTSSAKFRGPKFRGHTTGPKLLLLTN